MSRKMAGLGNNSQIDLQNQYGPYKNPSGLLAEIGKLILKFVWKCKGPRIAKTFLKKNKIEGIICFNFKTDNKTMVYIDKCIIEWKVKK